MKKNFLKFAPLSFSQMIFSFSRELFIYLIPDFSDSSFVDMDDVWIRFYIAGLFVIPLSLYLMQRLKLKLDRGFAISNLVAGFSLLVAGLAMLKENYSPLLYTLIYKVLNETCWIFSTTFAVSMMLADDVKKLSTVLAFLQVFFISGSILAPFIGYLIYSFNLTLIFLIFGSVQVIYSGYFFYSLKTTLSFPSFNFSRYSSRQGFKSSLILEFISQASTSFLFFTFLPSLQKDLKKSELVTYSLLLTFKISFLVSSGFFPTISKLHSNYSTLLLSGYFLSVPSFALLSSYISGDSVFLKSVSLTLLGFSSVWILSNFYSVPPLLRLFQSIKHLHSSGSDNDLIIQVVFIGVLCCYSGQYAGLLLGAAVKAESWYPTSSLIWAFIFSVLSLVYWKFLNLSQFSQVKLETKNIEMIDVNWEDSSH
jgi:MFS family permease